MAGGICVKLSFPPYSRFTPSFFTRPLVSTQSPPAKSHFKTVYTNYTAYQFTRFHYSRHQ